MWLVFGSLVRLVLLVVLGLVGLVVFGCVLVVW